MTLYYVTFMRNGEPYETYLYGKDRDDVMIFIKTHYKRVLNKIISVKQHKG